MIAVGPRSLNPPAGRMRRQSPRNKYVGPDRSKRSCASTFPAAPATNPLSRLAGRVVREVRIAEGRPALPGDEGQRRRQHLLQARQSLSPRAPRSAPHRSEPPAAAEGGSATAGDSIARRAGRDRGRSACTARRGGVGDMRGGSCFANEAHYRNGRASSQASVIRSKAKCFIVRSSDYRRRGQRPAVSPGRCVRDLARLFSPGTPQIGAA